MSPRRLFASMLLFVAPVFAPPLRASAQQQDFKYGTNAATGYGAVPDNWIDATRGWRLARKGVTGKTFVVDDGGVAGTESLTRSCTESAGATYAAGPGLDMWMVAHVDARVVNSGYMPIRYNHTTKVGYIVSWNVSSGTCSIAKRSGAGFINFSPPIQGTFSPPAGVNGYVIVAEARGTSPTKLRLRVHQENNNTSLLDIHGSDNSITQGNTEWGLWTGGYAWRLESYVSDGTPPPIGSSLQIGPCTQTITALTKDSTAVVAPAATGGVGTVTYQWYYSLTNPAFTPPSQGTAIAGATNLTQTLTSLKPDTTYYLRCVATDSTGPATVYSPTLPVHTLKGDPITGVTFIGDSLLGIAPNDSTNDKGSTTAGHALNRAAMLKWGRRINVDNQAHGGAYTVDWLPGAQTAYLSTALTSAAANNTTIFVYMLGTNDGNSVHNLSPATFQSNTITILNAIFASFPDAKIILYPTPWNRDTGAVGSYNDAAQANVEAYNSTSYAGAKAGCSKPAQVYIAAQTINFAAMNENPVLKNPDGTHLSQHGVACVGQDLLTIIEPLVGLSSASGGDRR